VLEFTFIAQTFETMASLDAPDDVKVLSTDPNTIQAPSSTVRRATTWRPNKNVQFHEHFIDCH
jgi:hypothetical protein